MKEKPMPADSILDLRGVLCPLNFVKAKVKLEEMQEGQVLKIILDDGDAMQNVPRSLKEEGHRITEVERRNDGAFGLLVRKGG